MNLLGVIERLIRTIKEKLSLRWNQLDSITAFDEEFKAVIKVRHEYLLLTQLTILMP